MIDARVAYLTNRIPPHRLSFLKMASSAIRDFQIYISTPMESNCPQPPVWADLNVQVQNSFSINHTRKHPGGFSETVNIHIPYDTIPTLQKFRPDVIISGELGFRSLQSTLYSILNPASRLILWCTYSERTEQGRGIIKTSLRRWLLPRADAILVNGESGAKYIRQFDVPDSRMFYISYAPPLEEFTRIPVDELGSKLNRILIAGRLVEGKGVFPFLYCLNKWLDKHPETTMELLCAGDGPLLHQLETMSMPSNLHLRLLGNLGYEEMPEAYASADILAFPTLADEWGLVVNEALAVGLPVLGSLYSQAVEELIVYGETGWTFHPDNQAETMQAIDQALSIEPERLAKMRLAARKKALVNSPSIMVNKLLQAIEFVLK